MFNACRILRKLPEQPILKALFRKPDSLCAHVVKGRYFPDGDSKIGFVHFPKYHAW